MADVFLSYARASVRDASRIAAELRASGFSVWFDENLPAHRSYADVIEEELEAAAAVLVLWSQEAARSQWVRSEANRARESGRLVQVRLDDARLPMPFDQIQCTDLRGRSGAQDASPWKCVLDSVAALAAREPDDRAARFVSAGGKRSGIDRRRLIIAGGGFAAAAALGSAAWRAFDKPEGSPEAQLLLQKGLDAMQQIDALDTEQPPSAAQAIALLTKATEANPQSATAWGSLAMAYAVSRRSATLADRPGLEERSRSAAQRALALEENEYRALAALRMLDPVYRNWLAAERAGREVLKLRPRFPIHIFLVSDVLGSVGRWREAAALSARADRNRFLIPGADRKVIVNLWAAGRLQEADAALREAVERWPDHPQVWRTRIAYLLYTGRAREALELLDDDATRPAAIPSGLVDAANATGEALAGSGTSADAVRAGLAYVRDNPTSTLQVAQACVAVGEVTTAMELLDGYYFGQGSWASLAPPGGDHDRQTSPLFLPPMRKLWGDARFNGLLERIGLNAYWRQSGTLPDYQRFG